MMAGNPNWWSMHPHHHLSSSSPLDNPDHPNQDFPFRSWSQLLQQGAGGEDERYGANLFQQQKKLENWEEQVLNLNPSFGRVCDVKQELVAPPPPQPQSSYGDDEFLAVRSSNCSWTVVSSPTSCITNNILNFSSSKSAKTQQYNQHHSSECNSSTTGGVPKKARVQHSSAQPALKVRKEKLGDRITALHQLVSPFGKTDTASVLSEAIGYIRFLQGQIEALSSPYMRNAAASTGHRQHSLLNEVGVERATPYKQESSSSEGGQYYYNYSDLRSRGLCLVPISSCTQHMATNINDTADYWAPAALGGSGGGASFC